MKLVRSLALGAVAVVMGCSAEAQDVGVGAQAVHAEGYGYEFEVDRLDAAASPAPGGGLLPGGRLSPEGIQQVVRENADALRACANEASGRIPSLSGKVVTSFFIDQDGSVSGAASTGEGVDDAALFGCMKGVFEGIAFPVSSGGKAKVIYPIELGGAAAKGGERG